MFIKKYFNFINEPRVRVTKYRELYRCSDGEPRSPRSSYNCGKFNWVKRNVQVTTHPGVTAAQTRYNLREPPVASISMLTVW